MDYILIKEILVLCHNDIDDKFGYCFQNELIKMVLKMSSLADIFEQSCGDDYKCLNKPLQIKEIYFFFYFEIPVHIQIQRARMLEFFFSRTFLCLIFFLLNLFCRTLFWPNLPSPRPHKN